MFYIKSETWEGDAYSCMYDSEDILHPDRQDTDKNLIGLIGVRHGIKDDYSDDVPVIMWYYKNTKSLFEFQYAERYYPEFQATESELEVARTFVGLLDLYEFDIGIENGMFFLSDNQYADLGDIESDRFSSLDQVLDRLSVYHEDYVFEDIELREEYGYVPENDYIMQLKRFIENEDTKKLLSKITACSKLGRRLVETMV